MCSEGLRSHQFFQVIRDTTLAISRLSFMRLLNDSIPTLPTAQRLFNSMALLGYQSLSSRADRITLAPKESHSF